MRRIGVAILRSEGLLSLTGKDIADFGAADTNRGGDHDNRRDESTSANPKREVVMSQNETRPLNGRIRSFADGRRRQR